MDSTDGLSRVVGTGNPIKCQLELFTDVFQRNRRCNDGLGNLPKTGENGMSIHRQAPRFEDLSTSSEVLLQVLK
jgi:F-type H+-transporting ATPase subunit beta